jgi:hypothetical protein
MQRLTRSFVPSFLACLLVVAAGLLPTEPQFASNAAGVAAAARAVQEGGRRGMGGANGINISRRETGDGIRCVRAEGDVDAPLATVGSVALDIDRAPEWVSDLVDVRSLRTVSETQYVLYGHFASQRAPDRAFLLSATLAIQPSPLALVVDFHWASEPTMPTAKEARAEISNATFEFGSLNRGKRTHVSLDVCCERANDALFCGPEVEGEWESKTILELRARLKKGDIAIEPRLKAALDESPPLASSFESVRDAYHETVNVGAQSGAPDLTKAQLAAPLANAAFLGSCGAPEDMKVTVRVAVRMGRAVGVTVTTDPRGPAIASCIDRAVRKLRWESSPSTDFVTTTY